jgi:hypothetical protein
MKSTSPAITKFQNQKRRMVDDDEDVSAADLTSIVAATEADVAALVEVRRGAWCMRLAVFFLLFKVNS